MTVGTTLVFRRPLNLVQSKNFKVLSFFSYYEDPYPNPALSVITVIISYDKYNR